MRFRKDLIVGFIYRWNSAWRVKVITRNAYRIPNFRLEKEIRIAAEIDPSIRR